jgi:hypothetical protein
MPHSPLLAADPQTIARTLAEPAGQAASAAAPTAPAGTGVPILVRTADRLREAIVINEILQPPLALRRRGRLV